MNSPSITNNCYYIYIYIQCIVVPTHVEKMRAELANLNHCAVPLLRRAAVNLSWYDSTCWCIL